MPKKQWKYSVKIAGVTYNGNTKKEVAEKAKITIGMLNKVMLSGRKLLYNKNTKEVDVFDVKKGKKTFPLLIRKYNFTNKDLLKANTKKENFLLKNEIPGNAIVDVIFDLNIRFYVSDRYYERKFYKISWAEILESGRIPIKVKEIEEEAQEMGKEFILRQITPDATNITTTILRVLTRSQKELELVNMKLREEMPLQFSWVDINKVEGSDCTKKYLLEKYPKIKKSYIENMGDVNGVTPNEILEFCKKYDIKYECYDITGNLLIGYEKQKTNKSHANLIIIAYNNHIYPIDDLEIIRRIRNHEYYYLPDKVKKIKRLNDKLVELLEKKIVPIVMNKGTIITGIVHNEILYIDDENYEKTISLAKELGIYNNMNYLPTHGMIMNEIEKNFISKNSSISSLFPNSNRFIKGGFTYSNPKLKGEYVTIDKNKCYSYALYSLPYLIKLDYITSKITKCPDFIIEHYLYIAKPKQSTLLLPDTNIYTGYHLLYAKKFGVEFELYEEITTVKVDNILRDMITMLYEKLDPSDAKDLINRYIGTFELTEHKTSFVEVKKIGKGDEIDGTDGYKLNLGDYTVVFDSKPDNYNIWCRKPISVQIKDQSRILLFEKMLELGLTDEDIKQVKTDSITFINKSNKKIKLDEDILAGWKFDKYNPIDSIDVTDNNNFSFYVNEPCENILYNCYAGTGKTHNIINKLIPKLQDYIVLTPSHSSLREYKKKKIVSDVIQKYSLQNIIPEQHIIIIDECGMIDRQSHHLLIKCKELGKKLYLYGDFQQLLPVGENQPLNSDQYLKYLAPNVKYLKKNRRNDFTIEYYDEIINCEDDKAIEYVKDHSTSWDKIDKNTKIICYRNSVVDKYNKKFMDKFEIEYGDINMEIICITNDLRTKDIYNNFQFKIINKIKEKNKIIYTITDHDKEYKITESELNNKFLPSYAVTLYSIQGSGIKSYHYPEEDFRFIKSGREAYTIVSRLIS